MAARASRVLKFGVPAMGAVLGGAYVYDRTRLPYEPRFIDFAHATKVVVSGLAFEQAVPDKWLDINREILERSLPRDEVSGVNRALERDEVRLGDEPLARFLAQAEQERSLWAPGYDLVMEEEVSDSFRDEHREVLEEARGRDIKDETELKTVRKEAATAKVGEWAHRLYGMVKASEGYGAATEDDLGMGTYNQIAMDESRDEAARVVREKHDYIAEQKASISASRSMRDAMKEMRKQEEPAAEEKDETTFKPPG